MGQLRKVVELNPWWRGEKTGPDTYPVTLPLCRVESAERDQEGALAAEKIKEK